MKELGVSFEDDEIAEMLLNMNLETVEDVKQFVKDREGLDLIYVNRDVEEEDE
jgi:acyl carrier protein